MTTVVPVLSAVTGRWEAVLAAGLDRVGGGVVLVRRCADLAELLAAAAAGQGRAAVLSADLRSLGSEALSRLELAGVAVVVLVEPDDDGAARRLHHLGVGQVLPADAEAEDVAAAIIAAVAELATCRGDPAADRPPPTARETGAGSSEQSPRADAADAGAPGAGSPGPGSAGAGWSHAGLRGAGAPGAGSAGGRSGSGGSAGPGSPGDGSRHGDSSSPGSPGDDSSPAGSGSRREPAAGSAGHRSAGAGAGDAGNGGASPTGAGSAASGSAGTSRSVTGPAGTDASGKSPSSRGRRPRGLIRRRGRFGRRGLTGQHGCIEQHGLIGQPGLIGQHSAAPSTALPTAYGDPRRSLPKPLPDDVEGREATAGTEGHQGQPAGRVVAVWGPAGAPGRTTTAVGLATEIAEAGGSCLLVDADTYAGSVAQVLGLLDEAPGLATAARAADHGTLDVRALSALAPQVSPGVRVLTGLSSASRWPEIRPASFATVLRVARELTGWTVVDTSSSLEQDEELSYDTAAPRRNGVTLQALQDADVVVVVGSADPIGLQRLVRGLQDLAAMGTASPIVVVNRVRASAVGPGPERAVRRALARYAGVNDPLLVPYDRPSLDAAVLQGRTLAEAAPSSPVRAAHARLAARLGAAQGMGTRTTLRGLRRLRLGAGVLG